MVLYCREYELLFTSDHVLFDITPNIGIWPDVNSSLSDYLSSLEEVKKLSIKHAFPARREASIDFPERVDQIIKHHDTRMQEILEIVRKYKVCSAFEIASHIS